MEEMDEKDKEPRKVCGWGCVQLSTTACRPVQNAFHLCMNF